MFILDNMERIKIEFDGVVYNAVEINGECVSDNIFHYDTIIIAESKLNNVITDTIDLYCDSKTEHNTDFYKECLAVDEQVFGYAPKHLILNGSEEELEKYARELL